MFGGNTFAWQVLMPLNELWVFDLPSNTWSISLAANAPYLCFHTASLWQSNTQGSLLVFGGWNRTVVGRPFDLLHHPGSNSLYMYSFASGRLADLLRGTWTQVVVQNPPTARAGHVATVLTQGRSQVSKMSSVCGVQGSSLTRNMCFFLVVVQSYVVYGGLGYGGELFSDVMMIDLAAPISQWVWRTVVFVSPQKPFPVFGANSANVSMGGRIVVRSKRKRIERLMHE
jgi:hypothetical protein